jgi:hypothetical protein
MLSSAKSAQTIVNRTHKRCRFNHFALVYLEQAPDISGAFGTSVTSLFSIS